MSAADRVVTDEAVLYEATDTGVAILTFNRPDRMNAWGGRHRRRVLRGDRPRRGRTRTSAPSC